MATDNVPAGQTGDPFGSQVARVPETAIAAAAAQAKAEVEAAYLVALSRPRDMAAVRQRLLAECLRPGFADAARYSIPREKWDPVKRQRETIQITGPSIRFAEAALRCLTNIRVSTFVLYDDEEKRVCRVTALDLEANTPLSADFVVEKTQERKSPKGDASKLKSRLNTYGDIVYLVPASESDVAMKQNAAASKVRRGLLLQLLPGDILDEAMERVDVTQRDEHARDPKAATNKLVDGFARLGVSVEQLREYLGHGVDRMAPQEWTELRSLGTSIADGNVTWDEAIDAKRNGAPPNGDEKAERSSLLADLARTKLGDPAAFKAACTAAGVTADNVRLESLAVDVLRALKAKLVPDTLGAPPPAAASPDAEKAALCKLISGYRLTHGDALNAALAASSLNPAVDLGKVDIAVLQDIAARMAKAPKGGAS